MPSYASVLARNLRAARAAAELSQAQVSRRMKALGFSAWVGSTVSLVERGKRTLTAEEIFALSFALETTLARLVTPAADSPDWITFPAGQGVHVRAVVGSARGVRADAVGWDGDEPVFMATSYPPQFGELFDPGAVDPRAAAFDAAEASRGTS
jgi:transcriptional regulator with XRE-family HTH domain